MVLNGLATTRIEIAGELERMSVVGVFEFATLVEEEMILYRLGEEGR